MKLLEKLVVAASYSTAPNQRGLQKPNEDRLLCDTDHGIFIVLDGVTRIHEEYAQRPYESAAADVADLFLKAVYDALLADLQALAPETLLKNAIRTANAQLIAYRAQKTETQWGFAPSSTGLICLLRNGTLYYAAAGDCLGLLLRGSGKQLFGCQWQLEAVDKLQVTKRERYSRYCNHPESPLCYTVFNGDPSVADTATYSSLELHRGDMLLLASDGLANYLKYEPLKKLRSQTPAEMIADSAAYDRPPFGSYADDKTVIKLTF
jgi:serine/threonine protein phosphatase PrpC